MMLERDELHAVVAEASRAPSVHNIQPARWRLEDDSLVLFRATDRVIPVADPSGHDVQASLGAAFEGMAIALSARGLRLGEPQPEEKSLATGCAPVVRARIIRQSADTPPDPLAAFVSQRRAFRGKFAASRADDMAVLSALQNPDVRLVGADALSALAKLHDEATWAYESRPEYHRELWSWLRLSRRHPAYHRDGLNADCLALSAPERWAASRLLQPTRFAWLSRLGVARLLVSESGPVKSASAAILFCPRRDAPAFDVGRRFYRFWLEVTALGFHLTPMSASADHAPTRDLLESAHRVPSDRRIANVFRVGRIPDDEVAVSPRLPVNELLV
jgi:hypothetical protein